MSQAFTYTLLKTEINTDPKGYGYAAPKAAGDLTTVTTLLNQVRATELIPRDNVSSAEIFNAIVPSEWAAVNPVLTADQYLQLLMQVGVADLTKANVKSALDLIFPVGTYPNTNAALHALYTRPGSRVETLFGAGFVVSGDQVSLCQTLG